MTYLLGPWYSPCLLVGRQGIINENREMRNRQKGFPLIELLIVVAIILIVAAIAIPI